MSFTFGCSCGVLRRQLQGVYSLPSGFCSGCCRYLQGIISLFQFNVLGLDLTDGGLQPAEIVKHVGEPLALSTCNTPSDEFF